jgi:hypothetical protein
MISHNAEDLVDALYKEIARQNVEIERLKAVKCEAERVCWFDWSNNDDDAAAAIVALQGKLAEYDSARNGGNGGSAMPTVTVAGRPWWATGCVGYKVGWVQALQGYFWMPHVVYGGDGDG